MLPLGPALALAALPLVPPDKTDLVDTWIQAETEATVDALRKVHPALDAEALGRRLRAEITSNLQDKAALSWDGRTFPITLDEIHRTVVQYEGFKLRSYVTSGVFAKRYFGYFDGKWDTARQEVRLAEIVHGAVEIINAHQAERGSPLRVTDAEVAVTWVAEGGAILLRELQDELDRIHPILGVGLDDIHYGARDHAGLIEALDAEFGTDLLGVATWEDGERVLNRYMTFEESILGTAFMWLWEKEIANRKLVAAGRKPLYERGRDEQFVVGSFVYNSGLIHNEKRATQVLGFDSAAHLYSITRGHPDRPLPVTPSRTTLTELLDGVPYRDQPTSWIAVYHILQRYGGYRGLFDFTDVFDETGMLVMTRWEAIRDRLDAEAAAAQAARQPPPEPPPPGPSNPAGCGCSVGALQSWLAVIAIPVVLRRKSWRTPGKRS